MNFAEFQVRALQEGAVHVLDDSAPAPMRDTPPQNAPTPAPDECPPEDSEEAIKWMNARYFVAFDAGRAAVMAEERDPVESRLVLKSYSFQDIRQFYLNRYVETRIEGDRTKREPLGKHRLSHPKGRQYAGVVLSPHKEVPGYYNLWRGFSVVPNPGDWSLMDAHIRENICKGDDALYAYVRKWLAFAVQHPERLPQTALVMRGKQGTGKGVFARGFGLLFGQHFLHLARSKNLVGNFNAHLRDAILVFADEAFLAGDREIEAGAEGVGHGTRPSD